MDPTRAISALRGWFANITGPQAACFVAGLGALYLMRDSLPADADGWKQVGRIIGYILAGVSTAGALAPSKSDPITSERTSSEPPEAT